MSYDLYLVRAPEHTPPADVAVMALAAAEAELPTRGLSPQVEAQKQALAAALRRVNPSLEVFAFDHAAIARSEGLSIEDARSRYRHLELNGAEDGNGVQITLYDDWASVTLPYWHRSAAADAVWTEVWSYLSVLQAEGGLTTYDPQLDRPLVLGSDRAAVQEMYTEGVELTARVTADVSARSVPRKPWWKVW